MAPPDAIAGNKGGGGMEKRHFFSSLSLAVFPNLSVVKKNDCREKEEDQKQVIGIEFE